ncbi:double zinc ribbon domain-containing protein [Haloarcula salinisoli]|uniref:Zinc ribbon domain-containing protein n=1 Tax=Haloarcula salinisoli TaxID=2487746 RepID=A0A8J8CB20_9EURY|nr:zinc ribbon domain-containing protein [Halomicroarcula salinisoli]MBX0303808.1 zinc ribbon domain-containing protein [Halomicroarcula salinisoli]
MSDASTKQSVECPICGDEFDPTVAGGWCTNTECGEWQYTEGSNESDATEAESTDSGSDEPDDGFVSPAQEAEADSESVDLFDEPEEEADDADEAGAAEEDDAEAAADSLEDTAEEDDAEAADPLGDTPEEDDVEAAEDPLDDTGEDDDAVAADADDDDATEEVDDGVDEDADAVEADATDADDDEEADATDADDEEAEPDVIDCPDCGVDLDAAANFCVECGADVSDLPAEETDELDACPSCEADVEPEDNFCVSCGEDLDAYRAGDVDHDAIDALEASDDDPDETPESLVLEVEGREIHVDDGDTVGREIRAALTEAGRPDDEAVRIHREHVRFVREENSFYLLDLGDNPTQINGQTLKKGDREVVAPGDELELSGVASVTVQAP